MDPSKLETLFVKLSKTEHFFCNETKLKIESGIYLVDYKSYFSFNFLIMYQETWHFTIYCGGFRCQNSSKRTFKMRSSIVKICYVSYFLKLIFCIFGNFFEKLVITCFHVKNFKPTEKSTLRNQLFTLSKPQA